MPHHPDAHAPQSPLLADGSFQVAVWRRAVSQAAEGLSLARIQTLAPFGFEVTSDPTYLRKHLNRFYCYFGTPTLQAQPSLALEQAFASALLREIWNLDRAFYERIAVVVFQRDNRAQTTLRQIAPSDLVINVENRVFGDSILNDYSRYIAGCLFAINDGTLPELIRFSENQNVRNRLYQLYLILEYSTSRYRVRMSPDARQLFRSLHTLRKSSIMHYATADNHEPPTTSELQVRDRITRRLRTIRARIDTSSEPFSAIDIKCYNNEHRFSYRVPRDYYETVRCFLTTTYESFPPESL